MTARTGLVCAIAMAFNVPALAAGGGCKLARFAELPVTMSDLRPLISAKLNGEDAVFVADSGAFFSMMSAASAAQFKLKLAPTPGGFVITGTGGSTGAMLGTVKEFGIAGASVKNVQFLVGGSEVGRGAAGILGQNIFRIADVEYDLAHGAIRLMRESDCRNANLAYWAAQDQSYSDIEIEQTTVWQAQTIGSAFINGKKIRVMFDSGAATSILSLDAAERAGVTPTSPLAIDAGFAFGIGRNMVRNYIAPFSAFRMGNEEIRNTRLRIGDLGVQSVDMLLGADFFLSHRILVSNSERKAFITYNGGAVFNLSRLPTAAATAPAPSAATPGVATPGVATPDAGTPGGDTPADPAGFARRGEAFASRQDLASALADLSKACELKPDEAEYFYRRALLYMQSGNAAPALADLDRVVQLKQDFLPAYLPRAEVHLAQKDKVDAVADLESVDRLAPKQADLRLQLGHIYARLEDFPSAITQFSLWIGSHPEDARLIGALSSRCLARALQNQDVHQGLDDCSKAVRRADMHDPSNGSIYSHRGLIRLRLGDYNKAITDFNAALKLLPKDAQALYGRGVAESRDKQSPAAAADMEAARAIQPKLPENYQRYGIAP